MSKYNLLVLSLNTQGLCLHNNQQKMEKGRFQLMAQRLAGIHSVNRAAGGLTESSIHHQDAWPCADKIASWW